MFAAGPTPAMRAHSIAPARPERRSKHATFSCGGSFSKQQKVGDVKTGTNDDEPESANYKAQVTVEKATDRERRDEEQAEVRARNTVCPNAAREVVDSEQERITIDHGGCGKRAFLRRRLAYIRDAPRDRGDD